jgi:hypothetical protein
MNRFVAIVIIMLACNGSSPTKPLAGSGSAQVVAVAVAAPTDAALGLSFVGSGELDQDDVRTLAFDKRVPRLPAISGSAIAEFELLGDGPMSPPPYQLAIRDIDSGDVVQTLPILDATEGSGVAPKTLHDRAAAVLAQLQGYRSLEPIELADGKPAAIGSLMLATQTADDRRLVVELRAADAVVARERIDPFDQGTRDVDMTGPTPCHYRPWLSGAYRDPVEHALMLAIAFWFPDGCGPVPRRFVVWRLDVLDAIRAGSADVVIGTTGIVDAADARGDAREIAIAMSRDGKSAWATSTIGTWRATDVLVQTPTGWRLAARDRSAPVGNAELERDAKAGKRVAAKLAGDPGDASLNAAFAKLTTDGVDPTAAARTDLVAIGSGPGERTVGGGVLARAWNAAWKGKVTVASSIARVLPSGTTGWVAASVAQVKSGYQVPFTVFCVFDKTADGAWTLVHIHFAT